MLQTTAFYFKFYPEGCVVTSGLSKWASAGGWRVGYALFPKELSALQAAVSSAASHTYSCCAAPQQYAAAEVSINHPNRSPNKPSAEFTLKK